MQRNNYLLIVFILCFTKVKAQDIHLSQFYAAPLALNPALTGLFPDNDVRLIVNARNQWQPVLGSDAYNTANFSTDFRLPIGYKDQMGFGLNLTGDEAGSSNFKQTIGKISFSYLKSLGGNRYKTHYLAFGSGLGFNQRSVSSNELRRLSQIDDRGIYNSSIQSNEMGDLNSNFKFFDLNIGLMWYTNMPKYYNFYAGFAIDHLNRPNVSFLKSNPTRIHSKWTLHGGGEIFLADKRWALLPNAIAMKQGASFELNLGTALRHTFSIKGFDEYKAIQAGAWLRLSQKVSMTEKRSVLADAIILYTRFDYADWSIGFSYDANISSLRRANAMNGTFELSIARTFGKGWNTVVSCPRF